ncbi:toxin-antitoxin system YwqK family antitoxin [Undibacterium sp. TJN19]|uniref:toxin-antitoxin system YwqK family antitoxin n=1 Tax=Undibacterium sp. TJN19 TaxID=3413055 RepID=UPI003BF37D3E
MLAKFILMRVAHIKLFTPIASVALLSALSMSNAWAIEECQLNKESVSPANGSTTAGKTGIMQCRDKDSGKLLREQELRAGVFMGLLRYYKDGVLYKEYSVNERGNRDGKAREFAPSGQVVREENYVNSNSRGLQREWYPNGVVRRISFIGDAPKEKASVRYTPDKQLAELECADKPLLAPHVNDAALCGFQSKPSVVQLFNDSGRLKSQFNLVAGVSQQSTYFHENGKPDTTEELTAKQRIRKIYSDTGVLRKETIWNVTEKPAVLEREVEYHESGAKLREQIFAISEKDGRKQNRLQTEASFYLNGQSKSVEKFSFDGKEESKETRRYFDNGQLASTGRYILDGRYSSRAVGVHQSFSQSGKLLSESFYDDKGRIQRERLLDESGKVLTDDLLFEDGSRKAYAK